MAKININFDTITKELDVVLDGQKMENVSDISIYGYSDDNGSNKGYVDIDTYEFSEDTKISKRIRISADEQTTIETKSDLQKDLSVAIKQSLSLK